MSTVTQSTQTDCGCCENVMEDPGHKNRPGQPALNYRIGTHASFLRRMLAQLARQEFPSGDHAVTRPLARLTTRATDDAAIAMLDAWATAADVLTFYQERIANEGFLRTATERRSVLELARAIGYELNPGVAAGVYLAFTVDESDSTPDTAIIKVGTQVQSIPAKEGELPQTFETGEGFQAKVWWNRLRPRLHRPQEITLDSSRILLKGMNLNLSPGDRMLLVQKSADGSVSDVRRKRVREVKPDTDHDHTEVIFETKSMTKGTFNAINALKYTAEHPLSRPSVDTLTAIGADSNILINEASFTDNAMDSVLDARLSENQLQVIMKMSGRSVAELLEYANQRILSAGPAEIQVFVLREKAGIFGHNAPYYKTLSEETRSAFSNWDNPDWKIWCDSVGKSAYYHEADIYLERPIPEIIAHSWLLLERPGGHQIYRVQEVLEGSRTGFGMSSKVTGLKLADKKGKPLGNNTTDKDSAFKVRTTTAYAVSEELALAPAPITATLKKGDVRLPLNGLAPGLQAGQAVAIHGGQADAPDVERNEVKILDSITHEGGISTLKFTSGLAYNYRRETVTINANVVLATHGETVSGEVLGSGDGARTNQRFTLKQSPLTYVSAATASGAESTLEIRVNDVLWQAASSLYSQGKSNKTYVVRIDDDARATVIFGDGKSGARLPTGQENIKATYRFGIGKGGEVGADSLTLLKKRPFGVRSVTNPVAASGAADPEKLENARQNAPLTVLTLDRIVSLRDFEDFARAFAGIGKAQAVSVWNGESSLVHITVADDSGDPVSDEVMGKLKSAIDNARDPSVAVKLDNYELLTFRLEATVQYDAAHLTEKVQSAIEGALHDAFSFDKRNFGQPVTAAEIISIIHQVEGVIAVDLDALYARTAIGAPIVALPPVKITPSVFEFLGSGGIGLSGVVPLPGNPGAVVSKKTKLAAVLSARTARRERGKILPAQLLLLDEAGIHLTMKAV